MTWTGCWSANIRPEFWHPVCIQWTCVALNPAGGKTLVLEQFCKLSFQINVHATFVFWKICPWYTEKSHSYVLCRLFNVLLSIDVVVLVKSLFTETAMSIKDKIPNSLGFLIDSILPILQFAWAGFKLILTGCLSPLLNCLQPQDKPLSRFGHNFGK